MADCERLATCPFFNDRMSNMPATTGLFKKRYCQGDNSNCARYMVLQALGKEKLPADLFPNERERAQEIITQR
jgi:hypothetical protein